MLSASCVPRGVVLLERDTYGEWRTVELEAAIALARCPRCGTRTRVLPYDILPYKRYSLGVISALVSSYAIGSLSLRRVVWDLLGERTPAHTTLHGWTEGLGAHALGLPGAQLGGAPFSRFLVEAQTWVAEVAQAVHALFEVDERRYRSEARRERLAGVAMLLAVAAMVVGELDANTLAQCRSLALRWSRSCVLVFPSRLACTAIEQVHGADRPESRHPLAQSRDRCLTRTRSPPGASSKSRP